MHYASFQTASLVTMIVDIVGYGLLEII